MLDKSKYTKEDLADEMFIALVCPICDIEIGYDPCPNDCINPDDEEGEE